MEELGLAVIRRGEEKVKKVFADSSYGPGDGFLPSLFAPPRYPPSLAVK